MTVYEGPHTSPHGPLYGHYTLYRDKPETTNERTGKSYATPTMSNAIVALSKRDMGRAGSPFRPYLMDGRHPESLYWAVWFPNDYCEPLHLSLRGPCPNG